MAFLTQEQVERFNNDGYLMVPGFASKEECQRLKQRAGELLETYDVEQKSVFSTKDDNAAHSGDPYFMASSANISFFLEDSALNQAGKLTVPKELAINKIGHAMHEVDPVFRQYAQSDRVMGILRALGYRRPLPVQSMYIFKQPRIGGEVDAHQDSTFLYTDPPSAVGMWLALEDATKDNGCMCVLDGSHKQGLSRRMLADEKGELSFTGPAPEYDISSFRALPCEAGTLILLHGTNVHYSAPNTSSVSRHSFTMHFVESGEGYTWAADNWAQRPADNPWVPLYDDAAAGTPPTERSAADGHSLSPDTRS